MLGIRQALGIGAMIETSTSNGRTATEPAQVPTALLGYWICPHVYVRNTQDGCVLLDLRRDKYLGLTKEHTALLAAAVNEWPAPPSQSGFGEGGTEESVRSRALCDTLLKDGLISTSPPAIARDRYAQEMDLQEDWVSIGDELDVPSSVRFSDFGKFLMAFAAAWISLKYGSLDKTVETVRKSRSDARAGESAAGAKVKGDGPGDIFRMARAVGVFRRLRTYVFAPEGRCLLHALTLTKFLGLYGLHPKWVIGINTQPWAAHSWVQWGRFLLDTTPEKVGRFLPILVV